MPYNRNIPCQRVTTHYNSYVRKRELSPKALDHVRVVHLLVQHQLTSQILYQVMHIGGRGRSCNSCQGLLVQQLHSH